MRMRYLRARSRSEKSLLSKLEEALGYARKHAIAVMNAKPRRARQPARRTRSLRYQAGMPVEGPGRQECTDNWPAA